MPLQTKKTIKKFDYNPENKTVSIAYDEVAVDDDGTVYVNPQKKNHRCAFVPGDIDKVKEYMGKTTGPEIAMLKAVWTASVIDKYKKEQEEKAAGAVSQEHENSAGLGEVAIKKDGKYEKWDDK